MIDINRAHDRDLQPGVKLAYKPAEAAAMLSISVRSLWSMMKSGKIRPIRIGTSVRYTQAELERFLGILASDNDSKPASQLTQTK